MAAVAPVITVSFRQNEFKKSRLKIACIHNGHLKIFTDKHRNKQRISSPVDYYAISHRDCHSIYMQPQ